MTVMDMCFCILILAGAFTLVSLGFMFVYLARTAKEVSEVTQILQETVEKSNVLVDDINNKMELLNAPVEFLSGIFDRINNSNGIMKSLFGMVFNKIKK